MRYIDPKAILDSRFAERPRPAWEAVVLIFRDARVSAVIKDVLRARPFSDRVFSGMEAPFTWRGHVSDCMAGNEWTAWDCTEDIAAETARLCKKLLACDACCDNRTRRGSAGDLE